MLLILIILVLIFSGGGFLIFPIAYGIVNLLIAVAVIWLIWTLLGGGK